MTKKEIKLRLQDVVLLCKAETEEIWLNLSEIFEKISMVRAALKTNRLRNELKKKEINELLQQLKETKKTLYYDWSQKLNIENNISAEVNENYRVTIDIIRSTEKELRYLLS